jgi:hypothetical protein
MQLIERLSQLPIYNMDSVYHWYISQSIACVQVDDQSFNVDHPTMRNIMEVMIGSGIRNILNRNVKESIYGQFPPAAIWPTGLWSRMAYSRDY